MSYYYDSLGYARPTKKLPQDVPYNQWAPQMWKQFTDLASNFKSSQDFASQVHSLISQIPCPECKTDGESYVKTNPPENISSKAAAQNWVQTYHKHVDSVAKGWGDYASGGAGGSVPGHPGGEGGGLDWANKTTGIQGGVNVNTFPGGGYGIDGSPGQSGAEGGAGGAGGDPGLPSRSNFPRGSGYSLDIRKPDFRPIIGNTDTGFGEWYSDMWADLHGAAENFDPRSFAPIVRQDVDEIPCSYCEEHARAFIKEFPPEGCKNRAQAMEWMCEFHNWASDDAGNGQVDCMADPRGWGYVSGHRSMADSNFYYGGGGGGRRGGGGQQGGRRGGGGQQGGRRGGRGGRHHGGQGQGGGMGPQGFDQGTIVSGQPGQPGSNGAPGQPGIGGSGGAGGSSVGGIGGAGGAGGVGGSGFSNQTNLNITNPHHLSPEGHLDHPDKKKSRPPPPFGPFPTLPPIRPGGIIEAPISSKSQRITIS